MYYIPDSHEYVFDYKNHKTYIIKENDTLASVAAALDIDPMKLRRYHNRYCPLEDLIEKDFKSHLKYLILQPEKSLEIVEPQEAFFGNTKHIIPFYPVNFSNNYAYRCTIEDTVSSNTFEYKVSLKWLKTDKNGICLFEIDKISETLLNGKKVDTITNKLTEETARIIYPLHVIVNQVSKWIDIYNFEEIKERFNTTKIKLLDNYEGDVFFKYLTFIDQIVNDKELFFSKYLSDDYFLRAFFNGINVDYGSELKFQKNVFFPAIPKSENIIFDVHHKVEEYLNPENLIVIEQNGIVSQNQTEFYTSEIKEGNYYAKYFLDPNQYSIEKMMLECEVKGNNAKKITIGIYNLLTEQDYVLATKQSLLISAETKKPGFFNRFL